MTNKPLAGRERRHSTCKLTNAQAFYVRGTRKRVPALKLARDFGVSTTTIFQIRQGSVYRDVVMTRDAWREVRELERRYKVAVDEQDAMRTWL